MTWYYRAITNRDGIDPWLGLDIAMDIFLHHWRLVQLWNCLVFNYEWHFKVYKRNWDKYCHPKLIKKNWDEYIEYEHDEEDWFGLNICKFMVCFNYWGSVQSSLSKEGFMASYCLTQDGLGKDNHLLSIILYFVADILFYTNGRICFLK